MKAAGRILAQTGFTLVELAVVLFIVALLAGGLLMPLSAQIEVRRANEAQRSLMEIRDALLGYAAINGRLPCPSTENDPASANYGNEDSSACASEAYLPWKVLGVAETDPWGTPRVSAAQPRLGAWRYRVDHNFAATAIRLNSGFTDNLSVRDNAGNSLTTTQEYAVAVVFSTGPKLTADGANALPADAVYQSGERTPGFDDQLIWLGRPTLFSRLIAAGRLP